MDGPDRRLDRTRTRPALTRIRTGGSAGLVVTSRSRAHESDARVRVVVSAASYVWNLEIIKHLALAILL